MAVRMEKRDGTFEVRYEGRVLADRERNYRDDSDFYALVWDDEAERIIEVEYATTRFGGTDNNSARVDATPEVLEKAFRWRLERAVEAEIATREREALKPLKGRRVRIPKGYRGRGKNAGVVVEPGTEGIVIWLGKARFGYGPPTERVGIKIDGLHDPVWLDAWKVEVVSPDPVDPEEVRAEVTGEWEAHRDRMRARNWVINRPPGINAVL